MINDELIKQSDWYIKLGVRHEPDKLETLRQEWQDRVGVSCEAVESEGEQQFLLFDIQHVN